MEPTDATIQILQKIQETLAGLREDTNARLDAHGERFAALERHAEATHEILGLMNSRLGFFERAAIAATDGRVRLDDRVDRLDAEIDRLRARVETLERGG